MSTTRIVRDLAHLRDEGLLAAFNELNTALAGAGLLPHHAPTPTLADTGTADLAAVVVIANALKALYNAHGANVGAHVAVDATNVITSPDTTSADQTATNTLLNEIKSDFNAHIALVASHRMVLGAGVATLLTVATTDASDLATSKALAAALLLALNRHFSSGSSLLALAAA